MSITRTYYFQVAMGQSWVLIKIQFGPSAFPFMACLIGHCLALSPPRQSVIEGGLVSAASMWSVYRRHPRRLMINHRKVSKFIKNTKVHGARWPVVQLTIQSLTIIKWNNVTTLSMTSECTNGCTMRWSYDNRHKACLFMWNSNTMSRG